MKKIGLLGGMSWESTLNYYKWINEGIRNKLGGLRSARIALNSVDFQEIERLQMAGQWEKTAEILIKEAKAVEAAGADFLLLCTNTMHKNATSIENAINIPFLHIADATAACLKQKNITKVGLLGTRFTMEEDFYKGRLKERHGLEVIIPNREDMDIVHRAIYSELCLGKIFEPSKNNFLDIIRKMKEQGAEGVILGCTEISILIKQADTDTPLFDTTYIHTNAAVDMALN